MTDSKKQSGTVWRRYLPTQRKDVLLAALVVAAAVPDQVAQASRPLPVFAACLAAAFVPAVAVAWRDRLEWRLLIVAVAGSLVATLLTAPDTGFPGLIALATISLRRTWRFTALAWVAAVMVLGVPYAAGPAFKANPIAGMGNIAITAMVAAVIAAIGLYFGARRAHVHSLEERNAALERERELLERERELLAREAIAMERARIARELHDVVAHHVSVMVIQAGAAEATLPPGADQTQAVLESIRDTGREALAEMRRLLGLLREPADVGRARGGPDRDAGFEAEREPQPGVSQLPILVARMRELGVSTALEYSGTARRLPPGIDLSLYRIAQEALTNTLRHAGRGASARLRLAFEPSAVGVEVTDDGLGEPEEIPGRPRGGNAGGHGLVGMRERVGLFGGRMEAGPVSGGGFRVCARFPLDDPAAPPTAPARLSSADAPGDSTAVPVGTAATGTEETS